MINHSYYKLICLIKEYLDKRINTDQFCYQYEDIYNFEIDEDTLAPNLKTELRHLFNVIVRYSPYKEDIEEYDCYYDSDTIRNVVVNFSKKVNLEETINNFKK